MGLAAVSALLGPGAAQAGAECAIHASPPPSTPGFGDILMVSNACPTRITVQICLLAETMQGPFRNPQRLLRSLDIGQSTLVKPLNGTKSPFSYKLNICRNDDGVCSDPNFACLAPFADADGGTPHMVECTAGARAATFIARHGQREIALDGTLPKAGAWSCSRGRLVRESDGTAVWHAPNG